MNRVNRNIVWALKICAGVIGFLCIYLPLSDKARGAEPQEIIRGKQLFGVGVCGFKGQEFKAFAGEVLLAPESAIDRFENCALFVQDRTMNPVWIVLFDEKGQPKEIIQWSDPATFERLWITGFSI